MAEKLNEALVRRFVKAPPDEGAKLLWDDQVSGFGVKLAAGGRATFVLYYRTLERRQRIMSLGLVSEWPSVAAARDHAAALKRKVLDGADPMGAKHEARAAANVNDLCDRYEKECFPALAPSTRKEWKRKMKVEIRPSLGNIKVRSLTFDDVQRLHAKISGRKALREANATIGLLRTMLNRAIAWKWITTNPVNNLKFNPDHKRERYLTAEELKALNKAIEAHPDKQAANAVRLLLLTGARRGEVLGARWDQFDFAAGTWHKQPSDTKQRKSHLVPLSAAALQLLAAIRADAAKQAKKRKRKPSPFVFPSHGRTRHLVELKKDWQALRDAAGIPDVRLHDLRHSYASVLVSAGLSLPIIGALLGHSSPTTTSRYSHLMLDPLKQATETAAAVIQGRPSAEIIPFAKAAS